ncbi:MAG: hypothetical protein P4M08_00260 [Oligoflexia bacterium]|nr:hypothetical protein [Oligoflexia bacterium]
MKACLALSLSLTFCLLSNNAAASVSLEEKLNQQWQNYQKARALLLDRAKDPNQPIEDRLISRSNWEAVIALQGDYALTPSDIDSLLVSQRARIRSARAAALKRSPIDLNEVRARQEVSAFCAQIPKGGMLHIHPGGTVDRSTAEELLTSRNPVLPIQEIVQDVTTKPGMMLYPNELSWLKSLGRDENFLSLTKGDQAVYESFLFLPRGKQPFERFQSVFDFVRAAENDHQDEKTILNNFARRAMKQGVIYVEFTTGFDEEMLEILSEVEAETGLTIRLNKAFSRTKTPAELDKDLQPFLATSQDPRVLGVDFIANESGNPALEKGQMLYGSVLQAVLTGKTRLHRTMHAGETGDTRDPRDAMILGAERLGHGVTLASDPVALEYAARIHEPIEINLSSNLRLTSVKTVAEHPFLDYLRLGLPVSLSTDDEGIFDTDIDQECELAVSQTDISYAELKEMAFNSIETSFASDDDKKALRDKLARSFMVFEKGFRAKATDHSELISR